MQEYMNELECKRFRDQMARELMVTWTQHMQPVVHPSETNLPELSERAKSSA